MKPIIPTQKLVRMCGYWATARHLANRGYDFEQAYWLIFQRSPRLL